MYKERKEAKAVRAGSRFYIWLLSPRYQLERTGGLTLALSHGEFHLTSKVTHSHSLSNEHKAQVKSRDDNWLFNCNDINDAIKNKSSLLWEMEKQVVMAATQGLH